VEQFLFLGGWVDVEKLIWHSPAWRRGDSWFNETT